MYESLFNNLRKLDLTLEESGTDQLVRSMEAFVDGFSWAKRTGNIWVGEAIPGVLGLFLVELAPSTQDIDPYTWVIIGDVPPAYISPEFARSPKEALEGYIAEMEEWVNAVESGRPTSDLIPVNGAPTQANAAALRSRLTFLSTKILPLLPG